MLDNLGTGIGSEFPAQPRLLRRKQGVRAGMHWDGSTGAPSVGVCEAQPGAGTGDGTCRAEGLLGPVGPLHLTTGPGGVERARLWVLAASGHPWGWVASVGRTLCGTLALSAGKGRASWCLWETSG